MAWVYFTKTHTHFFEAKRTMRDYPAGTFHNVPRAVASRAIEVGAAEPVRTPNRGEAPSRGE